jgi:hypothetical protein
VLDDVQTWTKARLLGLNDEEIFDKEVMKLALDKLIDKHVLKKEE